MSIVRIIWRIPHEVLAVFEPHLKVVPPFNTGAQLKNGGTLLECKQGNILDFKSSNLLYVMVLFTILENKGLILINTTLSNKSLVLHNVICQFI